MKIQQRQKLFNRWPRLTTWIIALVILIIPLVLLLIPYPVVFHGKIYTYDLTWNFTDDQANSSRLIEEMGVTALNVKGEGIKVAGKETRENLDFLESNQTYSVQDLEVTGNYQVRVKFSDGQGKFPDFLYLDVQAEKITFNVVNASSKDGIWTYQEGALKIQSEGQDHLPIEATSLELGTYLPKNHRNDLFTIENLPVSSMKFENSNGKSTIIGGNLSSFSQPDDVILDKKQNIKLGLPGITRLNELSLSRQENQLYLLALVTGKTAKIELNNPAKNYQFNLLEFFLGSENTEWLILGILAGFMGLLFDLVKHYLKNNQLNHGKVDQ
jgi:DUF971 family protein